VSLLLRSPGPWARNELWRRARAVPSLDLQFADSKSLIDAVSGQNLVTITRASSGTFVGSDGVLRTAATNEPRFDHNPLTGESLGLLVEEARTNSITNNTMVGAVAGTPGTNPTGWAYAVGGGGVTREIVGTGTEDGISYIDYRFYGTTTNVNPVAIGIQSAAALTGQSFSGSTYWKLVGGTTTGLTSYTIGLIELSSSFAFVSGAFYGQTAPTSAALITQRAVATRTLSGGATVAFCQLVFQVNVTNSTAIDFTLRIGLPQLEQGAFATSPIPTTTAAVTRAADVVSITGSAFSSWYRQDEGTMFVDVLRTYSENFPGYPNIFAFSDGTAANAIAMYGVFGSQVVTNNSIQSGGVGQTNYVAVLTNVPGPNRIAQALAVNSSMLAANGALTPEDSSVAMPVGINRVRIGADGFSVAQWGGHIRRLTYWPQRLPNSTLQNITQ